MGWRRVAWRRRRGFFFFFFLLLPSRLFPIFRSVATIQRVMSFAEETLWSGTAEWVAWCCECRLTASKLSLWLCLYSFFLFFCLFLFLPAHLCTQSACAVVRASPPRFTPQFSDGSVPAPPLTDDMRWLAASAGLQLSGAAPVMLEADGSVPAAAMYHACATHEFVLCVFYRYGSLVLLACSQRLVFSQADAHEVGARRGGCVCGWGWGLCGVWRASRRSDGIVRGVDRGTMMFVGARIFDQSWRRQQLLLTVACPRVY